MVTASKQATTFEVREATEADRPELLSLLTEMIPGVDAEARWRWLYETNPAGPALSWLALAPTGEVAGCTSMFPFRMWLDGEIVRGALGGDGYVRPAFRRQGVGAMLHEASRRDMRANGLGCMYGAPGAMNVTPLKHGGSRELGQVIRFVRPLRVGPVPVADLLARAARPWRAPCLEPMRARDPRVDTIWAAARPRLRLAAVRDAEFYTWRFRQAPAQREPAYVITRRGEPIGACALESVHDGHELHIVDLVAIPGAWHACLRAILRQALDATRASVLSIKLFASDARRRRMWRSGFFERDRKPFLCMIPADGDRRFLDPLRWFYCGADSDLDRLD